MGRWSGKRVEGGVNEGWGGGGLEKKRKIKTY